MQGQCPPRSSRLGFQDEALHACAGHWQGGQALGGVGCGAWEGAEEVVAASLPHAHQPLGAAHAVSP